MPGVRFQDSDERNGVRNLIVADEIKMYTCIIRSRVVPCFMLDVKNKLKKYMVTYHPRK